MFIYISKSSIATSFVFTWSLKRPELIRIKLKPLCYEMNEEIPGDVNINEF